MSADNGIYILKFRDQSRVIHAQAIENLWWSFLDFNLSEEMVPTRVVEYYAGAVPMTKESAREAAFKMEKEILDDDFCPILEYGVCSLSIDKTWDEVVEEAKVLARKEIDAIRKTECKEEKWSYNIECLEQILQMNDEGLGLG